MIGETIWSLFWESKKALYIHQILPTSCHYNKETQSLLEQEGWWVCLRPFLLECGLRNSSNTWELVGRPYSRPWVRIFVVTRVLGESRSNLRHSISNEWPVKGVVQQTAHSNLREREHSVCKRLVQHTACSCPIPWGSSLESLTKYCKCKTWCSCKSRVEAVTHFMIGSYCSVFKSAIHISACWDEPVWRNAQAGRKQSPQFLIWRL